MTGERAERIAVLGAGSWGTALSVHLRRTGHDVRLWARDDGVVAGLRSRRTNPRYLTEIEIPEGVLASSDAPTVLSDAQTVVVAIPSHVVRTVVRSLRPWIPKGAVVVSATKGLEAHSLNRMSQVIAQELPAGTPVVVLSGPSFALEVARGLPTAVLAASASASAAAYIQDCFRGPSFRLYGSDDVAGVEIGGALKNVIAIAAGVVEGIGLGHNSMAALITRGLVEISRLAGAEGGRRETLSGLSGLGDLVLTCTGNLSRNRHVGVQLGKGRSLDEVLAGMHMVAEGVRTTGAALALGSRHGIELPIAAEMSAVLEGRRSPGEAVEILMGRRQRLEPEHHH